MAQAREQLAGQVKKGECETRAQKEGVGGESEREEEGED